MQDEIQTELTYLANLAEQHAKGCKLVSTTGLNVDKAHGQTVLSFRMVLEPVPEQQPTPVAE